MTTILNKIKGLFINGNRVGDVTGNSNIVIEPRSLSVSSKGSFNSSNITINKSKIIIDGIEHNIEDYSKDENITIEIHGDFNRLESGNGEIDVQAMGNINSVSSNNGAITVRGDVFGDAITHNGNIKIEGDLKGNAKSHNGSIKTNKNRT